MPLSIATVTPSFGIVSTSVTIAGTEFGAVQGANTISFNGIVATPTHWDANQIVAPVPNGATTGPVVVTVGGAHSNAVLFTVTLPPAPPAAPPEFLPKQLFDSRMKANDVLQEHLKQIITVSSATLVLTISFFKDVIGASGKAALYGWLLPVCWIALAVSLLCAIVTIAILVNHLDRPDRTTGVSGYEKSFAAGATNPVVIATVTTLVAFSIGMVALAGFGAENYQLFLRKSATTYQLLSETNAVEITKKNLPSNNEFIRTSKVELQQGSSKLPGSIAVWHVQVQVKEAAALEGQQPVYTMVDYYVDALTGQGSN
jgi:hypothetical protein